MNEVFIVLIGLHLRALRTVSCTYGRVAGRDGSSAAAVAQGGGVRRSSVRVERESQRKRSLAARVGEAPLAARVAARGSALSLLVLGRRL